MTATSASGLPEDRLNELLRAVDWRFLLAQSERPRALVLGAPRSVAEGVALIADLASEDSGEVDLVVLGFPTRGRLRRARAALRPGGEVVCLWRRPRIAGAWRARKRLRQAGLEPASVHWPGPHPTRQPEFWLPIGEPAAAAHLFGQREPRSRTEATLRRLLRLAVITGLLVPLCAVARMPRPPGEAENDEIAEVLLTGAVMMVTQGNEARHKILALAFAERIPTVAVKFARIASTDDTLNREADALDRLEKLRPTFRAAPRVLARGRRVGRSAIAESIVPGRLPPAPLSHAMFARLAPPVTERLLELVDAPPPVPESQWRHRLVDEPLERFAETFGAELGDEAITNLRRALADLPPLPLAWEHRDCAVWNLHLDRGGQVGFFDWAGSEPRGLPGLDLAYFLATSAFMIDRVQMRDPQAVLASHRLLLDRGSPRGRVAATCIDRYSERLGLDPAVFPLLRMRGWVAKADPKDPAAESFARLAIAELKDLNGKG